MQDPKETFNNIEHNTEMALLQSEKIAESVDNLEPIMEGILIKTDEMVKALDGKDIKFKADNSDVVLKLDELVSAVKDIPQTEIPEQKEVNIDKTNELLNELISEVKKKSEYEVEIDDETRERLRGLQGIQGIQGKQGRSGSRDTAEQVKEKLLRAGLSYDELDNVPDINKVINLAISSHKQSSKTYSLTELDDVNITDPTNAQVLKWNATTNKWENGTVSSGGGSETFETVSKNLKAYPYQISYSGGNIATITYDLGGGSEIIKTFGYTSGDVTSVTLSGNTPSGIDLVKTISYSGGNVAIISYL